MSTEKKVSMSFFHPVGLVCFTLPWALGWFVLIQAVWRDLT